MFKEFLLKFQAEGPMVHILYSEIKAVLLQVLRRVVKADEVNGKTGNQLKKLKLDDILLPL